MRKVYWKPIENLELYWVSSDGRVVSFNRTNSKILSTAVDRGYLQVHLKYKTSKVHRLVASAFCKRRKDMDEVNHKDGIKANNHYKNLEWTDRPGNMQHCDRLGLREFSRGEDHGMAKLN